MKESIKFNSKKDKVFSIFFYSIFLLLSIIILVILKDNSINYKWISTTIILVVLFYLVWTWYGTEIEVNGIMLFIKSGPLSKKIPIISIHKIEIGKTMWVGYKLGTSLNGIIIHYNKYDEIYITPENVNVFIKELKKVNHKIELIDYNSNSSPTT